MLKGFLNFKDLFLLNTLPFSYFMYLSLRTSAMISRQNFILALVSSPIKMHNSFVVIRRV
jgi:hypothetical protein